MNTTLTISSSRNDQLVESAMSTIAVMRRQEDMTYRADAGVYCNKISAQEECAPLVVDMDCRDKMAAWTFQVVDFLRFDRETVSVSMNYLDRYLMTAHGQAARNNRPLFQLATMGALYMAVKIHEPVAMDPRTVAALSQGAYTADQIEQMEKVLLSALSWRVNPPTALAFCRQSLDLLPDLDSQMLQTVYELCRYQTELAARDGRFVSTKASTVAFCALLNALECVRHLNANQLERYSFLLSQALDLDFGKENVSIVSQALYGAMSEAVQEPNLMSVCQQQQRATAEIKGPCAELSPRAVAHTSGAAEIV